jgi:hypothetical protein
MRSTTSPSAPRPSPPLGYSPLPPSLSKPGRSKSSGRRSTRANSVPLRDTRGRFLPRLSVPTRPTSRQAPAPMTEWRSFSVPGAIPGTGLFQCSPGNNIPYVIPSFLGRRRLRQNRSARPFVPGQSGPADPSTHLPGGSFFSGAPSAANIAVNVGSSPFHPPAAPPLPSWWSPWHFPLVPGAASINPGAMAPPPGFAWMPPLAPPFGQPPMVPGPPPIPSPTSAEACPSAPPLPDISEEFSEFRWGSPGISEWNPETWSPVPSWGLTPFGASKNSK